MEELLKRLLSLSVENEIVEFKEAKTQYSKDKLGEYFSALSNEANLAGVLSAWLVMGVKDNRSIVGTEISDAQINEYKNEIAQHTSPRNTFIHVYRVEKQGKMVLLFEIPAAFKGMPQCWKGHRYGRNGESVGALSDWEYDKIKNNLQILRRKGVILNEAKIWRLTQSG